MAFSATGVASGIASTNFGPVIWADSLDLFVAAKYLSSGTQRIVTSPDGETWTARTTPELNFNSIAWNGSLMVAVGNNASNEDGIATSPDGVTWTVRTGPKGTNTNYYGVCYASSLSLWAAVDGDGTLDTSRVITSPDGITWTARTTPNAAFNDMAWSPDLGLFVAIATSTAMSSSDGITWTTRSIGTGSWRKIYWSTTLAKFIVYGTSGSTTKFAYSSDGINWTEGTISSNLYLSMALNDDDGIIVMHGDNGSGDDSTLQSSNGTSWTEEVITGDDTVTGFDAQYGAAYSGDLGIYVFANRASGTYDFAILTPVVSTSTTFWYQSDVPGLESAVDATQITGASARPRPPRGAVNNSSPFDEDNPLFGYPGHAVAFENRMIYAANNYTIGADLPPIRVWNGTSDYQLAVVPRDGSGNIPKCVTTIVNGDGAIYFGTWDTGTSSANVSGRIMELDPNSGQMTNVGNVNSLTGYIPWSLWFHNGELWAGLHRSDTTAGRIYRIKPNEQSTWTLDRDLTTDSVGGCTLINAFQGKMYFGSTAASGTFAKFGNRDTAGTYSLIYTGTGGTAQDHNGFNAACVFGDNLYFSYWNPDATPVSLIKKYDGTTVTTAFTVTSVANVPIIGMFVHDGVLYALGSKVSGTTWTSVLLTTTDGTTWDDRTGDLPLGDFTTRGLANAFAVISY